MYEKFIDIQFSPKKEEIVYMANNICREYYLQGYNLSLRQLYYQFVARQPLSFEWSNSESNYKMLGNIISEARNAGCIDWEHIVDRGRETVRNSHWSSIGEILKSCADQFKIDLWENQPNYVMVMVEKQAMEGILEPICLQEDVSFTANKGYASDSLMYSIGTQLRKQCINGKELHVIYLGDHDPSGMDMTRDVQSRLERYSRCDVNVHRIALNMSQVEEYSPPENPAKLTDSRATKYIEQFGYSSWELDALSPDVLASLVAKNIRRLRDDKIYQQYVCKMNKSKSMLLTLAGKIISEEEEEG
jgi:hypothetical protein